EPGSVALGLARMGGRGGPIADSARRGRESRPRVHRYSGGNPTPAAGSVPAGRAAPGGLAGGSTSRALHRFQRQLLGATPKVQRRIVRGGGASRACSAGSDARSANKYASCDAIMYHDGNGGVGHWIG